jgi:tight adherence protein B
LPGVPLAFDARRARLLGGARNGAQEFAIRWRPNSGALFEEQNLGQPLEIVLKKLGRRMPRMDVQFFVSAVLLQKRTGGNLAELLDKLAEIIRERFKLRARIRAMSAQGSCRDASWRRFRLAVGAMMFVVNPQYARFFFDDPVGNQLLARAVTLQLAGYAAIRRIVTIEV